MKTWCIYYFSLFVEWTKHFIFYNAKIRYVDWGTIASILFAVGERGFTYFCLHYRFKYPSP